MAAMPEKLKKLPFLCRAGDNFNAESSADFDFARSRAKPQIQTALLNQQLTIYLRVSALSLKDEAEKRCHADRAGGFRVHSPSEKVTE